jgi:hypothetical protein
MYLSLMLWSAAGLVWLQPSIPFVPMSMREATRPQRRFWETSSPYFSSPYSRGRYYTICFERY